MKSEREFTKNKIEDRIPVFQKEEYIFIKLEEIIYIKSDHSYSEIVTNENTYVSSKNLKYYEGILSTKGFFRVNNSHLINIAKIKKYIRKEGGIIQMENLWKICVSKYKIKALKTVLSI